MYVIPSYLSFLKLRNYSPQCSNCAFFRGIKEKLFWVIETINKASATNSLMNLSHTLCVIAEAKAFCSILYISEIAQISWQKTSVSRGLNTFSERLASVTQSKSRRFLSM